MSISAPTTSELTRFECACIAALHSLWITATAVASALVADAWSIGALDTPAHFALFVKVNAFHCAMTVIFASSIRAALAAKKGTP